MKTPAAYTKNLQNHIITKQMLLDCLYSSNKRAKNWRDKEREYRDKYRNNRYLYDKYDSEERAREQKESYYRQKEVMLSVLEPVCIHREKVVNQRRRRIYDYEEEYFECLNAGLFIYENGYYDSEEHEYIEFGDILEEITNTHYYLFYDIGGNHTFHTPINEGEVEMHNLPIVDIEKLNTSGDDIADLVSNQFVTKVVKLIIDDDFEYVAA